MGSPLWYEGEAFKAVNHDLTKRLALIQRALAEGGVFKSPYHLFWAINGRCTGDYQITLETKWLENDTRMAFIPVGDVALKKRVFWLTMAVRCRQCADCLRFRARQWRNRASIEIRAAARTWFGTFTLSAENHYMMLCRARLPDGSASGDVFKARHAEISKEITKYFKRVRKESGAPLKYLLVAEKHKSGLPHYHALIHEVIQDLPVRHATLSSQWRLGFTNFKLVETAQHAAYVTKYLSKDAVARVRASRLYGKYDL